MDFKTSDSASAAPVSHRAGGPGKGKAMNDYLMIVAVMVGWFVLNAWVLPRFGVKT